jgi:hypothetical protein
MAYFSDASIGRLAMSHANFGNCLGIYYQNIKGFRTKQLEFHDVCASNFNIICFSETWLNDLCYDYNLFPNRYIVYRSDQLYINKDRSGGVLTAITASLGSCSRRYDLELCSECVWVEIPTADVISMLIGNNYFTPDTKPEVITDYFRHLEDTLDTNNTRVILLGDFNAPGRVGHLYLNAIIILNSRGMLYTPPHVFLASEAADNLNMLDLVFVNFTDLKSVPAMWIGHA